MPDFVAGVSVLAFFFYMSDRQLFGLLLPLIQKDTRLTKIQIDMVDTFLYWTVALMMPFSGVAFAMLVGWGVVRGLSQSNAFPSIFDVVPAECRASAVGFVNVFAYVVGSFEPVLFGYISHRWGVRGFEIGFLSFGALLVVAATMMAYLYFMLFNKCRLTESRTPVR